MSADTGFQMPTEPPVVKRDETVTVGAAYIICSACDQPVPVQVEAWITRDDEDGGDMLVLDSDIRDLELHAAVHEFEGDSGRH